MRWGAPRQRSQHRDTGIGTRITMRFLGQDAAAGALRSLYAAAGAVCLESSSDRAGNST